MERSKEELPSYDQYEKNGGAVARREGNEVPKIRVDRPCSGSAVVVDRLRDVPNDLESRAREPEGIQRHAPRRERDTGR